MVNLCLPDGKGGVKHYKTHLDRLIRHSGFFAAAARNGTKLKVRDGVYALDCSCRGFDSLLEFMRNRSLPLHLTSDDLASLQQLGSALDLSKDFWRALAGHAAARAADTEGGHHLCNGTGGCKGILKHSSGGANGTKRVAAAAGFSTAAPPPLAPRAKAYRRVLVDDMSDAALCKQPFFDGEWYGQPAEMRVVDTYDAEAPDHEHAVAEQQESSNDEPKQQRSAGQKDGCGGGGKGCTGSANEAAAQARAAADALLNGQPLARIRRFALLEFTFQAGGS